MYIMSKTGKLTVNSTNISSIRIEERKLPSDNGNVETKTWYCIFAYGKGNQTYLLAVYEKEDLAKARLELLLREMKENAKTFSFW